jgi:hypothetical protein
MNEKPKFQVIKGSGQRIGPSRAESTEIARTVLKRLVDQCGVVQARALEEAHRVLTRELGFALKEKSDQFVRPGGFQFFYVKPNVLVRIKTKGTSQRPRPHMTISLFCGGLAWDQEQAKMNVRGNWDAKLLTDKTDKLSPFIVLAPSLPAGAQDNWANRTHFDFSPGFDDSAAAQLQPEGVR